MRLFVLVVLLVANMRIKAVVKNCHTKILKNITFSALIIPDAPAALQFPREIIYNPNDNYIIQLCPSIFLFFVSSKLCKIIYIHVVESVHPPQVRS